MTSNASLHLAVAVAVAIGAPLRSQQDQKPAQDIRDLTDDTTELYDMLADPRERVNRFDDGIPNQADLVRRLEAFIETTNIPEAYR